MDHPNDQQIVDRQEQPGHPREDAWQEQQFKFYGQEKDDVESEIPEERRLFIVDVARPSEQIANPVDYAVEEDAERLIAKIDLMVKQQKVGMVKRDEIQHDLDDQSGNEVEQKEEAVTDVNELINYFGVQAGLLNDKEDRDLKKETEVDPTKKEQIITDLEEAVRKLFKHIVHADNDAENLYTLILEKAKKTKDRAHRELQIQDEFECMCLALHFYQWLVEHNDKIQGPERYRYIFEGEDLLYVFLEDADQLQEKNKYADENNGEYKKEDAKLVVWWMQMALNFMNAYRGRCTRYLKVDLEDEDQQSLIDYFQIGKVFNWPNFTLAHRNKDDKTPPEPRPEWQDWNLCFHIYGYNCKMLARVPGEGGEEYETVIFRPNSQFMVCKVEKAGDQVEVWIREIQLGLSRVNALWIDENIFMGDNEDQFSSWVRYNCDHLNIKLIMKTSSKSAWYYINSQAFRKTVKHSEYFKIIINKTCYVDVNDKELPYEVQQPWHSGPRFLQWFIMKGPQQELKPDLYKVKILLSDTNKEDAKRAMQECGMTIQQMQLLAIWVQIKNDNCDFMEFLTGQSQEIVRHDTRELFVEDAYQQREKTTTINMNIHKIQQTAEVSAKEAERLMGQAKGSVLEAIRIYQEEQQQVQKKISQRHVLISLEEHFGMQDQTFAEEQEILKQWEHNFDVKDANPFLKLTFEEKREHPEVKNIQNKFKDLTDAEAIAFYQIKILDRQGYLQKFQLYSYLKSLDANKNEVIEYNFPRLICQVHESYNSIAKIVKRQEPDMFITDYNAMSMNGKYKEPDQIAMEVKKEGYILLPFFLTGFFNPVHLKDRDVLIKEEKNSVIGSHQSCKITGYGGIYPPMTVFEFICIKDIEVDGRTVRDVTILKPTFKTSSQKNDSYPTEELLAAMKAQQFDTVRSLLEEKPMTYLEEPGLIEGQGLLAWACSNNHVELVKILCEYVINCDSSDNEGEKTALHIAAENNFLEVAEILISHKCNPFKLDAAQKPAAHYATGVCKVRIQAWEQESLKAINDPELQAELASQKDNSERFRQAYRGRPKNADRQKKDYQFAHQGNIKAAEKFGSMAFNLLFGDKQGYVQGLDSLLGPRKLPQGEPVSSSQNEPNKEEIEHLKKIQEENKNKDKSTIRFTPPDHDPSKIEKYSMEWEYNRGITWEDRQGRRWDSRELFYEIKQEIPIYTSQEPAKVAKLTDDEVIALRLYTSPCYQPINEFLRALKAEQTKEEFLKDERTFAQTVRHLTDAFEKLGRIEDSKNSDVALADDGHHHHGEQDLPKTWRAINGILPTEFFKPDDKGMISFLEYGFSSTSDAKEVIDGFRDDSAFNLTLEVTQIKNEITGCHQGVPLEWLTYYPGENEILFPPLTMFQVVHKRREGFNIHLSVIPFYNFQ